MTADHLGIATLYVFLLLNRSVIHISQRPNQAVRYLVVMAERLPTQAFGSMSDGICEMRSVSPTNISYRVVSSISMVMLRALQRFHRRDSTL